MRAVGGVVGLEAAAITYLGSSRGRHHRREREGGSMLFDQVEYTVSFGTLFCGCFPLPAPSTGALIVETARMPWVGDACGDGGGRRSGH